MNDIADPDPAIQLAGGAVDAIRAVCLAVEEAADRAGAAVGGAASEIPVSGPDRWDSALTGAWRALSLVYAGLGEARRLPGATPASVGDVLEGLCLARETAGRACADRPAARAAADRWGAACARLDLAAARLALDAYAELLDHGTRAPTPRPGASGRPDPADLAAGVAVAGALLLRVYPWRGRPGLLARVRNEFREEYGLLPCENDGCRRKQGHCVVG
jgi:hypothetical protein